MVRAVVVMLSAVSANETYLSFFQSGRARFFRSRSHRYSSSWSRDIAQLGSAPRSGRGGRGFESRYPDHRTVPQQRSGEVAALLHSPAVVRNVMGARCLNGSATPSVRSWVRKVSRAPGVRHRFRWDRPRRDRFRRRHRDGGPPRRSSPRRGRGRCRATGRSPSSLGR